MAKIFGYLKLSQRNNVYIGSINNSIFTVPHYGKAFVMLEFRKLFYLMFITHKLQPEQSTRLADRHARVGYFWI